MQTDRAVRSTDITVFGWPILRQTPQNSRSPSNIIHDINPRSCFRYEVIAVRSCFTLSTRVLVAVTGRQENWIKRKTVPFRMRDDVLQCLYVYSSTVRALYAGTSGRRTPLLKRKVSTVPVQISSDLSIPYVWKNVLVSSDSVLEKSTRPVVYKPSAAHFSCRVNCFRFESNTRRSYSYAAVGNRIKSAVR